MHLSEDPKSRKLIYKWIDVGVLDYDEKTKFYLVHKTNRMGLVRDDKGRCILNGGVTEEGGLWFNYYWMGRSYQELFLYPVYISPTCLITAEDLSSFW